MLGLAILVAVGFLVFRLLTGGSTPPPSQVVVPNFVGQTVDNATQLAEAKGLKLVPQFVKSNEQPEGTITNQDPPANTSVDAGASVTITVISGQQVVAVPDLRGKTVAAAATALVQAGLAPGTEVDSFDPTVPAGEVIASSPVAGTQVTTGTTVDYVVSKGPEPTATPSPTPSPTAAPTPSPTPSPTPTAALTNVGEYRCQTLAAATAQITGDGFIVGTVTPQPPGYTAADDSIVYQQSPLPGKKAAPGSAIDLTAYDPASIPTCPPAP